MWSRREESPGPRIEILHGEALWFSLLDYVALGLGRIPMLAAWGVAPISCTQSFQLVCVCV